MMEIVSIMKARVRCVLFILDQQMCENKGLIVPLLAINCCCSICRKY